MIMRWCENKIAITYLVTLQLVCVQSHILSLVTIYEFAHLLICTADSHIITTLGNIQLSAVGPPSQQSRPVR